MIPWLVLSVLLNMVLWAVCREAYKELNSERQAREVAELECRRLRSAERILEQPISLPTTAQDLIRTKREAEVEAKKKAHGPQPVSWVGKAAYLEALTEDPRFERALDAHKEIR